MKVSFKGFNEQAASFSAASGVSAGMTVTVTSNGTVSKSAADDAFAGIALNVDGGLACVQLCGYAEAAYTGTAPSLGIVALAGNGSGGVKAAATGGREVLAVSVDTTAKTVGFIM